MKTLKLKFTTTEFDADGDLSDVTEARNWWLENVFGKKPTISSVRQGHIPEQRPSIGEGSAESPKSSGSSTGAYRKTKDGKVYLAARLPGGDERLKDALLALVGGYSIMTGEDEVGGGQLMGGLIHSGYKTLRIDKMLLALERNGLVTVRGLHRGKKYALTATGANRSSELAEEISKIRN